MAAGEATALETTVTPALDARARDRALFQAALMVNLGWLGTSFSMEIMELPVQFLLKEQVKLDANALSEFMFLALIPIYLKPFAGILTDAVPLLGMRRKSYLVISLFLAAVVWLSLALVPRQFGPLLVIYLLWSCCSTMTSTVLGGVMVEVGHEFQATGRLSAQRQALTRAVKFITGPLGGYLSILPFLVPASIVSGLYLGLTAFFAKTLKEVPKQHDRAKVMADLRRQSADLFKSKTLWAAAGLVILVVAAPGFGTPLLYFQTDVLKFDKTLIGTLKSVEAVGAVLGTLVYSAFCRHWNLRRLLAVSILFHAVMTLCYLGYRNRETALIITCVEGMTLVLALLPLYDLSARATPRGSEALGYSLMMSVWNFTTQASNWAGSELYARYKLSFQQLVWVNSGTTLLVLLAVPFLPAVLMNRKEGEAEVVEPH